MSIDNAPVLYLHPNIIKQGLEFELIKIVEGKMYCDLGEVKDVKKIEE